VLSGAKNRLQKLSRIGFRIWLCLLRFPAAQSARGTDNALVDAGIRRGTNSRCWAGLCRGTSTCHSPCVGGDCADTCHRAGVSGGACRCGASTRRGAGICGSGTRYCGASTGHGAVTCHRRSTHLGASRFGRVRTLDSCRNFASGDRGLTSSPIPNRAGTACLRLRERRGRLFRWRRPCGHRGRAADRRATRS
jgi:hypothetical protein